MSLPSSHCIARSAVVEADLQIVVSTITILRHIHIYTLSITTLIAITSMVANTFTA